MKRQQTAPARPPGHGSPRWRIFKASVVGLAVLWSIGPIVLMMLASLRPPREIFDPSAKHRYTISRFNSVWKRDADGEWRVLFDGGTPPKPATREEVDRLVASLPASCAQAIR